MDYATFWALLDTLAKIAMGALLLGVGLWFTRNRTANTPTSPDAVAAKRKLKVYEEVSRQMGNVSHIFAKYSALVIESVRFGARWPQARRAELDNINNELVQEFRRMADAEANLLLIGEKGLEKNLRLYGAQIALFRKQVYVGRRDISNQEIADLKQDIYKLREQFYDVLSKKYDDNIRKSA
ncbi:energy transducer TonB [Simiduia sp. 21SJ11W-1]|uniref:energy transducer TonB n=1 Tax=Simiduia sp. 21SJ11W-1 TaxID=2909669 RepID=UPI00209CC595|nr:energy transducer TonB [Simiduia sp. 21SJ11W-1]UTA49074.1 energy transducer TonB [Simiduia sp. 21SJ11W-1]